MGKSIVLESWFLGILGVGLCLEAIPFVVCCITAATDHGHDAVLGWFACLVFGAFFLLTVSCFGWEWLLLKQRRYMPDASNTIPTIVFCVGFLPALIIIGFWLTTI
jgi:hypothetical protein